MSRGLRMSNCMASGMSPGSLDAGTRIFKNQGVVGFQVEMVSRDQTVSTLFSIVA